MKYWSLRELVAVSTSDGVWRSLLRFLGRLVTSGWKGRELGLVASGLAVIVVSPGVLGIAPGKV